MTLSLFVIVPLALGILGWVLSRRNTANARWLTLAANALNLALALVLWGAAASLYTLPGISPTAAGSPWLAQVRCRGFPLWESPSP